MEALVEIDSQNLENWNTVRDNPNAVLESASEILELARKQKYAKGVAWAQGNIGAAHMWTSNNETALHLTAKAREALRECEDFKHEADMLYNLCAIFYFLGDYEKQLQFGGPIGKKYMTKRFKELLIDISEKSFDQQQKILEQNFTDWKRDNEQVDDILVMGFKVS